MVLCQRFLFLLVTLPMLALAVEKTCDQGTCPDTSAVDIAQADVLLQVHSLPTPKASSQAPMPSYVRTSAESSIVSHGGRRLQELPSLQRYFQEVVPGPIASWNAKQAQSQTVALQKLWANYDTNPMGNQMQWHTQWDHDCSSEAPAAPGPIQKHFHFVLFEERGAWINWTHPFELISSSSPQYLELELEEQVLIENVRNTLRLNNPSSVHFLDTYACESATMKISKEFLEIYKGQPDLRYRADICRVAALYLEGGYYLDDDMLSYQPVQPLINKDTDFASVLGADKATFFQSFMAATPCHPVLKRNIEMMLEASRPDPPEQYLNGAFLGPVTLKLAYDEVKPSNAQLFHEDRCDPVGLEGIYDFAPWHKMETFEHSCEFCVYDEATKKLPWCSRF